MEAHTLIQQLTLSEVSMFGEDFRRFLQRGPHSRKQRLVLVLAQGASEAGQAGDDLREAFLHGMAAALYGVSRLAEAKELEAMIRPRLDSSHAAVDEFSDQTISPEEHNMKAIQEFTTQDVAEYFKADGLHHTLDEEHGVITANIRLGGLGSVQLHAVVIENTMILVYLLPNFVPECKRANMAEAISRANFGLGVGCFEMDFESGALGYRIAVPTDDGTVSLSQYRHCMGAGLATVGRFMPVFHRIMFGDAPATEVMQARKS